MRSRTMAHLLAGAALTAVGGCGGDDPLTKTEFISQADAICKQGSGEIAKAAENSGLNQRSSEAEIDAFVVDKVMPNIQDQANKIGALPAPEGDEDQVDEIVSGLDSAIEQTKEDPSSKAFVEVNELAQDYGLKECGQS